MTTYTSSRIRLSRSSRILASMRAAGSPVIAASSKDIARGDAVAAGGADAEDGRMPPCAAAADEDEDDEHEGEDDEEEEEAADEDDEEEEEGTEGAQAGSRMLSIKDGSMCGASAAQRCNAVAPCYTPHDRRKKNERRAKMSTGRS